MRSTFGGFETAKSGLFASQQALNVTGHNIANVNTIGYSRQRLAVAAIPPAPNTGLINYSQKITAGGGVEMVHIEQIRNPFLDAQYRQEYTYSQNLGTLEYEFTLIEDLYNGEITENDSGISATFNDFYSALHKLVENPSDQEIRKAVLESAIKITDTMNQNSNRIEDQYNNVNEAIETSVKMINQLAQSLADINNQIFSFELSGAKANDLRDSRNLLLDELSGIIPIDYYETAEGYLVVNYDGRNLVNHATPSQLAVALTAPHAFYATGSTYELYWSDQVDPATGTVLIDPATGVAFDAVDVDITGGSLGAYFKMKDGDSETNIGIPHIKNLMDDLCRKIVMEFNAVHVEGWNIPSNGGVSTQDNKFFDDNIAALQRDATGQIVGFWIEGTDVTDPALMIPGNPYTDLQYFQDVTADNFEVDQSIIDNLFNIAASSNQIDLTADNTQIGNNENALKMVELITKSDASGTPDNFDTSYKDIIIDVGIEMSYILRSQSSQEAVLNSISDQRQSIMGVSLDEEMTNIIKFGHSYNAASRVITAIDEELDTVINKMGLVGR